MRTVPALKSTTGGRLGLRDSKFQQKGITPPIPALD